LQASTTLTASVEIGPKRPIESVGAPASTVCIGMPYVDLSPVRFRHLRIFCETFQLKRLSAAALRRRPELGQLRACRVFDGVQFPGWPRHRPG
jgi:hypothetical protein